MKYHLVKYHLVKFHIKSEIDVHNASLKVFPGPKVEMMSRKLDLQQTLITEHVYTTKNWSDEVNKVATQNKCV